MPDPTDVPLCNRPVAEEGGKGRGGAGREGRGGGGGGKDSRGGGEEERGREER